MFVTGGLPILLAVLLLPAVGVLIFSRKPAWLGRLPGDLRHEGRRTRVSAPPASMPLLSPASSLWV